MKTVFAPFGSSEELFKAGCESALTIPRYLKKIGLNGFEYSCEEGIHISDDGCAALKSTAEENNIALSLYAGGIYSLSSDCKEEREKGIEYLSDCITAAKKLGCGRVTVPLGSCAVISRKNVFECSLYGMRRALDISSEIIKGEIFLCPELMGKIHDFGTLDEILMICTQDERFIPAVNFPNLFSRTKGRKLNYEDICNILLKSENSIGTERTKMLHIYISKAYFTNQGLKKYTRLSDSEAPDFDILPIFEAVIKEKINPFIVCRSPGFEVTDALYMKNFYCYTEEKNNENTFFERSQS